LIGPQKVNFCYIELSLPQASLEAVFGLVRGRFFGEMAPKRVIFALIPLV